MCETDWNLQAIRVADYIQKKMFDAHRGVMIWHNGLIVVFGNDGFSRDEKTREVVSHVRETLRSELAPAKELGFGLSNAPEGYPNDAGYTWAIVCRACDKVGVSDARDEIDNVLWAAWNESDGLGPDDYVRVQRRIANSVILRELDPPVE
jgi:hypothetical protein